MALTERQRRDRFERDYVFVAAVFAVLMVLTNIIGTKLFLFFPDLLPTGFGPITGYGFVVLTTGLVTYPLTFLFTDVCSEVYGRRRANYMVTLGFVCSLLMLAVIHVAGWVPRADRFWADAANQPVQGTQVMAAADGDRLLVDDAAHLLLADGATGHAAVLGGAAPRFITYTGLERPQRTMTAEDGTETTANQRWDHRGSLVLTAALQNPVASGTWVVPAVAITAVNGLTISVDRLVNLPVSGKLVTTSGITATYGAIGNDGQVNLTFPEGVALPADDLAEGARLAVVNGYSPAELQHNLISIISAPGILLLASMLAYLVAQYLDVWLYHMWKGLTGGRHLWLRNNGSTCISQLVDTIIVNGIFLTVAFGMDAAAVTLVIVGVYIVKMMLAWIDTPLIYLGVYIAKARLGYAWDEDVDIDVFKNQPWVEEESHRGSSALLQAVEGLRKPTATDDESEDRPS